MRYRLMATYHGVPYEAGVGPSDKEVVLFAACPPPEELGFQPATGHWRKAVSRAEVDAIWESRPSGVFRGEPCLVLDDLGERLHISYLGHDLARAGQLGYSQMEPGVFEVVAAREDVTEITEDRVDHPFLAWQESWRPAGAGAADGYLPAATADAAITDPGPGPAITYPAPAPDPAITYPAPQPDPAIAPPAPEPDQAITAPWPGAAIALAAPEPDPAIGEPGPAIAYPALEPDPAMTEPSPAIAYPAPDPDPAIAYPAPEPDPAMTEPGPALTYPAPEPDPAIAEPGPALAYPEPDPALTYPAPEPDPAIAEPGPALAYPEPGPALTYPAPEPDPAMTEPGPAIAYPEPDPAITGPGPGPDAAGRHRGPDPGPGSRQQRAARRPPRAQTRQIFAELAGLAALPPDSYAVDEAVDGAICLVSTDTGFEVFSAADGVKREARLFHDEEAAYFYLFGLLVAEAVRDGRLGPPGSSSAR